MIYKTTQEALKATNTNAPKADVYKSKQLFMDSLKSLDEHAMVSRLFTHPCEGESSLGYEVYATKMSLPDVSKPVDKGQTPLSVSFIQYNFVTVDADGTYTDFITPCIVSATHKARVVFSPSKVPCMKTQTFTHIGADRYGDISELEFGLATLSGAVELSMVRSRTTAECLQTELMCPAFGKKCLGKACASYEAGNRPSDGKGYAKCTSLLVSTTDLECMLEDFTSGLNQ